MHLLDVFDRLGIAPRILFGPEHGWAGHAQDMVGVDASSERGLRIVSLYGDRFEDLSPRRADLEGLDVVVIDMQDVGSRYYTFVWTAVLVARACRDAGVRVVVLDRPNPLGRTVLEGRMPRRDHLSFVGLEPLPIRHGLTLGEIVAWRAHEEGFADQVEIVGVRGLPEDAHAPAWDRAFVLPSPNMPTYETTLVYPGGCLLEGTNLSEGRGATRPFEILGAPWLDGARLARGLAATDLPGFVARPLSFEPTFQKHARKSCGGVQIHVTDVAAFRPVATYVALVALAQAAHPEAFAFRTERYEFVDHIPAFDLLLGSPDTRAGILAGAPARELAEAASAVDPDGRAIHAHARAVTQSRIV